jgi:hypothetical protein
MAGIIPFMAQRVHQCPNCGSAVEVPDDYFRSQLQCMGCGAQIDRMLGTVLQPGPGTDAPIPAPAYPVPPLYPAQYSAPMYMQAPKGGFPGWAIGLIVGGVAIVAAFIALTFWAVGNIKEARSDRETSKRVNTPPTSEPRRNSVPQFPPRNDLGRSDEIDRRLIVSFNRWTVYAYDDFKGYGFTARGGRAPYKWSLSGALPTGVTHSLTVTRHPDGEIYTFEGNAGPAWDYPLTMTVVDADGNESTDKGVFKVLSIPASAGALAGTTTVYHDLISQPTKAGPKAVVPVGLPIHGEVSFKKADEVRSARVFSYDYSEAPAWVKVEVDRDRLFFGGTPETSGEVKFTIRAIARVDHCGHDYELSQEITLDVTPLREDERPDPVGVLEAGDISGKVAVLIERVVSFKAPRPEKWNARRAWQVDAQWDVDLRAMNASVPPGVVVSKRNARDGEAPPYVIYGVPEEGGEWELEFKLTVTVKYVDDPYEFVAKVKISVEPLREDQIPAEIPPPLSHDWEVRGAAGHDLKATLTYNDPYRPATWTHDMQWRFTWEWLIDEIEAPEGVVFETYNPGGQTGYPHLVMRGSVATKGEWEFDIKVKVKVKYIDATYEAVQKVKLTIR